MKSEKDAAADPAAKKRALFARLVRERGIESRPGDAIRRRPEGTPPSLSFAQQRLWFLDQLEPDSPRYNVFTALRLEGTLHVRALAHSLAEIVRRHETLRARIVGIGGQPELRVAPAESDLLDVVDLGGLAPADRARPVPVAAFEKTAA